MAVPSLFITEEPGAGMVEVNICTLEINIKYEVISSAVCSVCLSFGLIFTFFGYRCFKMVMFFSGFMFGATSIPLLYYKQPGLDTQLGSEAKAALGLGAGVLLGLVAALVSAVGLLLSGLQLGGLLSIGILVVVGQFHGLAPAWVPLVGLLTASMVAALFTLTWQKLFTVVYTSVLGATAVVLCVDYLVGTFVLPDQVYDLFCRVAPTPFCWFNWAIAAIWPVLGLMGVLVQWGVTAKGASHTEAAYKKHKKHVKKHRYRELRSRPPPHRRRRPAPLKRYAGDVLAPSYLQRLQERQMETGSSTSSSFTHTLIDFDFETGSMVPLTAASPVCAV